MDKLSIISLEEASQCLGVSKKTLGRWQEQGFINPITRKQGMNYYSFENVMRILELKRKPWHYFLMMYNHGILPNTLMVTGHLFYDEGVESEESVMGTGHFFYSVYKKRTIKEEEIKIRISKGTRQIYLNHHDKNHIGPIVSRSKNNDFCLELKSNQEYEASMSMDDVWNPKYYEHLDASQTLPPKSFIGHETEITKKGYEGRWVRYDKIGGDADLADEIE